MAMHGLLTPFGDASALARPSGATSVIPPSPRRRGRGRARAQEYSAEAYAARLSAVILDLALEPEE
jgi:hypothetical protein